MKPALLLIAFAGAIVFTGCNKERISAPGISSNPFIDSATKFLKSSMMPGDFSTLDLKTIRTLCYKDKKLGIQIFENSSPHKFVVLKKTGDSFSGNRVDVTGMENKNPLYDTWTLKLESLDRRATNIFTVKNNKVVPDNNLSTSSPVLPEVIVYYTVDSYDVNLMSLYWLFAANDAYYYDLYLQPAVVPVNPSHGNYGSGVPNNVVAIPRIYAPETPVTNLKDELKCFTVNPTSTYTITVNVNQPTPGTRDKIDPVAVFIVGHTFLTLEEINSDGSKVTRNVGFYPKNSVKPGSTSSPSVFGDDSNTPFTVSLKISVSGSELSTVINTLNSQQAINYDMNTFNCVNSAMSALASIHVNLPATKSGDQNLFSGYNPGDLGEDIRALNLDNFSRDNGNRKIVRTADSYNDHDPDKREGAC